MWIAPLLVLLAAPASDPVGTYRLRDGPDVVSELVLKSDGRFE